MTPAVTIAIPFHNEAQALPGAIRCVFAQTMEDWELLLVDDGSTDGSREIALSVRDPRVTVLGNGDRLGLSHRLNEITAAARSELIARMDADDAMHPQRIERELAMLRERPQLSAVGTFVAFANPDGSAVVHEVRPPPDRKDTLTRSVLAHATVVARRAFLERFPYDPRFVRAEDRELFFRAHGSALLGTVEEPLYVVLAQPDVDILVTKYRESCRSNRLLFRTCGPDVWPQRKLGIELAKSYGREAIYLAASRFGLVPALVARRGRRPTVTERCMIDETIRASRDTSVPGLQAP